MRHRAVLTGTFQRATHYNKPLPRMKVQPLHVTGMINKRLRARERRRIQHWTLASLTKHIEAEAKFEKTLKENAARFGQEFKSVFQHVDWRECILIFRLPSSDVVAEVRLNFHFMLRQKSRRTNCGTSQKFPTRGSSLTRSIHRRTDQNRRRRTSRETP